MHGQRNRGLQIRNSNIPNLATVKKHRVPAGVEFLTKLPLEAGRDRDDALAIGNAPGRLVSLWMHH